MSFYDNLVILWDLWWSKRVIKVWHYGVKINQLESMISLIGYIFNNHGCGRRKKDKNISKRISSLIPFTKLIKHPLNPFHWPIFLSFILMQQNEKTALLLKLESFPFFSHPNINLLLLIIVTSTLLWIWDVD